MENADSLIAHIARAHKSKPKHFFHFTSTANLESIQRHGLLSQRRILELGISDVDYASDEISRQSDRKRQLDHHVHLCFFPKHRMADAALKQGRIADCTFVRVAPTVLLLPDVLLGLGATNSEDVEVGNVATMLPKMSWDVIYGYTDWSDPEINLRLQKAEMYEILVPEKIATEYLILP